ncbi:hypothetical protein [Clostridium sp. FP1]|uniref:hypothetical protein n=1 Tax=Clostridium sp. FP1 TaxID=2724076 RepID=UPI0013E99017|nr:hypothetical protein [Clostridium sp. FP1]MBZ9634257.1 hypothetical protein [Clostridium sp. FP1]
MDMEKLVEMITREVMKRITSSANSMVIHKKKVLVISSCEEELREVKELLEYKYEVIVYDGEDISLKNYESIIVTNLCNKGLSSMALGLCNDKLQELIVEALFKGKRVYVLKEGIQYRKYSTKANEALYNLYSQYECKIMSYGAIIVNEKDLLKSMEIGADCNEKSAQKDCLVESSNKRLITESDLKKLYMNGIKEVNLIKKAILTPLAQDFIRINQLKINRV